MSIDDESQALVDAYSELADAFSNAAPTKAENAFVEQPCMRKLLGPVKGMDVLDAGCGPGILAAYLVSQGAQVTGFDITPKMVELAKIRLKGNGHLFVANLAKPLPQLEDHSFDKIAASWVLDYVKDWHATFREMHRLLRPGGDFIFSVTHPTAAYDWHKPASAFGTQKVMARFSGFDIPPVFVPDYYRGIADMMDPILQSGFQLVSVTDPKPIPECNDHWPEEYEKYLVKPCVLCFVLKKEE